ncbi:hypothetical protein [Pararhodospirillum oryzae]|uniref:Uncharacterized protein n=1 Tax=Pararhodospirillum oryzae TaxID=478448 RepID=A0A512HBV5_9PROT|nr:hypothetical protein [Pararhodospirillum oryzae]GEO82934.1 hypothetical protein ROR02_30650 [Pararhodospirillum oryzae]
MPLRRLFSSPARRAALALCLALGVALPSQAAPVEEAPLVLARPVTIVVHAMPLGAVSLDRPIQVLSLDDSPMHQRLQAWFERALKARGLRTGGPEAPLVLDLDSSAANAPSRPDPSAAPLTMRGAAGTGRGEDEVAVGVRVFSNTQASVLGGVVETPIPAVAGPLARLDVGLTDRATGRRLWVGWASVDNSQEVGDGERLLLTVSPLAAALGTSTRSRTLTVPAGPVATP